MTEQQTEKAIRSEFKECREQPKAQKDWGLIWVLSGYETGWGKGSDTRRRMEEGIRLAKKVAKARGGAIPKIYISGYNEHNTNLKKWRSEDFFEKEYRFPKQKLLIGPHEHIRHTGDQFGLFPKKFLKRRGKIVIVTDAYHIPRVGRYVEQFFPEERERFVFYPTKLAVIGKAHIDAEVKKIIRYAQQDIIPLFPRKRVVITGATGFLGMHLLRELSRHADVVVVVMDRAAFKNKKLLRWRLRDADVVYHLAGVNKAQNAKDYQFNARSTGQLLAAMKHVAPDALFVYASSFAVYAKPIHGETISETSLLKPRSPYGRSKRAAEAAIWSAFRRDNISAVILRISNMYGPNPRGSEAIVDQIRTALKTHKPFMLRTSLRSGRDFIYVTDVVNALLRVSLRARISSGVEVFNVCSGERISIGNLLKMAQEVSGKRLSIDPRSVPLKEATFWTGSFQKAKKRLQWRPTVKLREGLRQTLK